MTPRPARIPGSGFEAALATARDGRFDEAARAVTRALTEDAGREARAPSAANALAEVARLAEAAGELAAAERALVLALELQPGYPDLHFRRACLLLRGSLFGEARGELVAALAINPRYVAARLELALLDAREGLVGEALEGLRQLSVGPVVGDSRAFQQGIRRLERAEWDEADALLRRALEAKDNALGAELDRLREVIERGAPAEAASMLRSLVSRFAAYPDLHALLGRAELALGHHDDAILALSRALELHPEYHAARVLLAHALEGVGEPEQARRQIALVLEHDPTHAEARECQFQWGRRFDRERRAA